jgi:hypothetical protein
MRFYVVAAGGLLASPCCAYQQPGWQLAAPSRFTTRFVQCHGPAELSCRSPGLHAVRMNAELAAAASKLGGTLVVAGSLGLKVS